jgi:hypothetical protein
VLIEPSVGQRGEAIEALGSPFKTTGHGQPTEVVGADAGIGGVLASDEALLIRSELRQGGRRERLALPGLRRCVHGLTMSI